MEKTFTAALLRLKEQVGVQTDREVAELLGMSDKALNARKSRGAFPEDKLFALMSKRPDLGLDAVYVLTGDREAVTPAERHLLNKTAEFTGRIVGEDADGLVRMNVDAIHSSTTVARRRQPQYKVLERLLNGVDDETLGIVFALVERLARDCARQGLQP